MKLVRQLSGSSQSTSSVTTRSMRYVTKPEPNPATARIIRNVSSRKGKTEDPAKNVSRDIDKGVVEVLNWNDGELSKEKQRDSKVTKNMPASKSKIVVPADAFNSFEEVLIKKEVIQEDTSSDNAGTDKDLKTNGTTVVGGNPSDSSSPVPVSVTCPPHHEPKATAPGKRVFIIKSVSGKSVTLIPRTAPIVLPKGRLETSVNSAVTAVKKTDQDFNVASLAALAPNILKPGCTGGTPKVLANNSQCMSTQTGVKFNIAGKQTVMKVCKVVAPNAMPKALNAVKNSSAPNAMPKALSAVKNSSAPNAMPKALNAVKNSSAPAASVPGKNRFSPEDIKDMPMYVDNQSQTELKAFKDASAQTELYIPSPTRSIEELPNIPDLVEYLLETPKYSNGLDEVKKSDLLGMSKNIIMKGNVNPQPSTTMANSKANENLKAQLFLDLKNCLHLDFLGNMPIHNAILESNISYLKRQCFALRLRKFSVNIENNQGLTPIQLAIVNGCDSEIMTILCENGADVTAKDSEGNTTIHLAVLHCTDYNLSLIIKHCPNPKNSLLNCKNDDGLTPLMLAAIESKADMVDVLLQNGADPNLRDEKSGRTALFHAVEVNSNFVINLLLKYRADPRIRNFFGLTVLDAAKDLDMQDVTLLENNDPASNCTANVNKRPHGVQTTTVHLQKKSKLSFIPSYQRVELSTIQKSVRKKYPPGPGLK